MAATTIRAKVLAGNKKFMATFGEKDAGGLALAASCGRPGLARATAELS